MHKLLGSDKEEQKAEQQDPNLKERKLIQATRWALRSCALSPRDAERWAMLGQVFEDLAHPLLALGDVAGPVAVVAPGPLEALAGGPGGNRIVAARLVLRGALLNIPSKFPAVSFGTFASLKTPPRRKSRRRSRSTG